MWLGSCSLCMGLEFSQAKHDMLPKCGSVDDTATAYIEFILPRTMMRTDAYSCAYTLVESAVIKCRTCLTHSLLYYIVHKKN